MLGAPTERGAADRQPAQPGGIRAQLAQGRPNLRGRVLDEPFGGCAVIELQVCPTGAQHGGEKTLYQRIQTRPAGGSSSRQGTVRRFLKSSSNSSTLDKLRPPQCSSQRAADVDLENIADAAHAGEAQPLGLPQQRYPIFNRTPSTFQ
jgi:hypothetical protein